MKRSRILAVIISANFEICRQQRSGFKNILFSVTFNARNPLTSYFPMSSSTRFSCHDPAHTSETFQTSTGVLSITQVVWLARIAKRWIAHNHSCKNRNILFSTRPNPKILLKQRMQILLIACQKEKPGYRLLTNKESK